jgi:hypothetical protein
MIVNCRRLRNILSFHPYLSVKCICASLPKIVDLIDLSEHLYNRFSCSSFSEATVNYFTLRQDIASVQLPFNFDENDLEECKQRLDHLTERLLCLSCLNLTDNSKLYYYCALLICVGIFAFLFLLCLNVILCRKLCINK